MLSIRFLLLIVCLVYLASCMSIRQLYDRAVKREQAVIADSSFGLMQHDDAGTIRHHEPSPPNQIDALKVRGDNTVLPVFGVGRMLRKFAPDYSTEWDE
ncbi:hypothetical protein L596_021446 [Steinernema carpocapsae]|uniref:Uncharacterized protein n=1 Tax=Steinernema carpocapsae TaxID=34508 RepID=A0A4V6XVW3_STECR|nr:hypothetical protein L596_021446 [Steinernema carpocapsae]